MAIDFCVRLVKTDGELQRVYRTRYEVYVEELAWSSRYANAEARTITDTLDRSGNIFAAFQGTEVLGTIRTHHSGRAEFGEYASLYGMQEALRIHPTSLAISTMLMVRKQYRNGRVAWQLMAEAFKAALADGVRRVYIDCVEDMVDFYRKLGFTVHIPVILHPEYGPGVCMSMGLDDSALMKALLRRMPVDDLRRIA